MKTYIKNKAGFTLIELLVVVAIIGLLSSIVLASLNGARAKARDAVRKSDLGQISIALELYYNEYGGYPSSAGPNNSYRVTNSIGTDANFKKFLPSIPKDPSWGDSYYNFSYLYISDAYNLTAITPTATKYVLYASLENQSTTNLSNGGLDLTVQTMNVSNGGIPHLNYRVGNHN
jgi:general secretion pathway protein G